MADPFDVATPTQRRIVLTALVAYVALFVVQLVTGNSLATAAADLLLMALVLPASVVVLRRATAGSTTDGTAVAVGVAFLVAGLTIGYEGLSALELVPPNATVSLIGSVALLVALVLYLYRNF